jgi:methionyl-tRNA formyltransferase
VNVILLGHRDIASLFALNRLISLCPEHNYSAFNSGTLESQKAVPDELLKLAKIDVDLCSRYLAEHEVDRALRSARELKAPNSPAGLQLLADCEPDLIVSIRYRRILHDDAIAIPRHGILNLHSGILPDYRGVMATFWAMLNEEPEIGATLHRIVDSGVDTGPVIGISRVKTQPRESYLTNVLSLYNEGCTLLASAIKALNSGKFSGDALPPTGPGRYYSTPDDVAIERFLAKNLRLAHGNELELIPQAPGGTRQ